MWNCEIGRQTGKDEEKKKIWMNVDEIQNRKQFYIILKMVTYPKY